MTERFYTPPHYPPSESGILPIFLAGPVQGASDWQTETAHDLLAATDDTVVVFSPKRTAEDQLRFDADEQKAWEFTTRDTTRRLGVTAFWWAAQDFTIPYKSGRAYAQTTRIELGEAAGWKAFDSNVKAVVGFDPAYSTHGGGSESYVRSLCELRGIEVVDSLDELKESILQLVKTQKS